ncbi:ABC transporter permease [Mycoplasmopsis opalescens]|uniref:ABC transporter permease n=1 Tax=Mycoplasmopsis opalescens TaxID=114886 RepID=UPI0004A750CD|nr:ABC transporter permease [Mycoplasmopsis opalescens]
MWRLFKEVLRSLWKNKILVIGLSILIFFTSTIFTLLMSVRTSTVGTINDYKKVSRLHDISVDLNFPSQGSAYNQGYLINGQSIDDLNKYGLKEYKPVVYKINYEKSFADTSISEEIKKDYLDENSLTLHFWDNSNEFISLKDLGINDVQFNQKYIKKDDLVKFYKIYDAEKLKRERTIEFNFYGENPNFKIISNSLPSKLYKLENGTFIPDNTNITITKNTNFTFTNPIKFKDIINLYKQNNKVYGGQPGSLYFDLENKKITHDYNAGHKLIEKFGKGVEIKASELFAILGFEYDATTNRYMLVDINKLNKFLANPISSATDLNSESKIKNIFKLSDFNKDDLTYTINQKYNWNIGQAYNIQNSWIAKKTSSVEFHRNNYYTSFIDQNNYKDKWTGAFKTFMKTLGNVNDKKNRSREWNNLETFSYWWKVKNEKLEPIDSTINAKPIERNIFIPLTRDYDNLEFKQIKLYTENEKRILPNNISLETKEENPLTIEEIEIKTLNNPDTLQILNFDNLTNANIRNERSFYISNKAYEITRQSIVDNISKLTTKNNIGLRQSITVDAVDENTGKKSVFHFINTGDNDFKVEGIKLNVGKLFNEEKNRSQLNNTGETNQDFFKSSQLPPYIASQLISSISKNLFPDPRYVDPKYDYSIVKKIRSDKTLVIQNTYKIVLLGKYDPETKEQAKFEKYGIYFEDNKFQLAIKENIDGHPTWISVPSDFNNGGFDLISLANWMQKNKLTIATKNIKVDDLGWVKKDNNFENIYYIPIYFLSPKTDLVNDIIQTGSVKKLVEIIENWLITSDLVKDKFLTINQVVRVAPILTKVLDKHQFANVFTQAKLNKGILPELIFDLLYELTNEENGNLVDEIFFSLFTKIKTKISSLSDIDDQKEYLTKELKNLFNIIKTFTKLDLSVYIDPRSLAESSKDPLLVIQSFEKIISSINLKEFSAKAHNWFEQNNNKIVTKDNKEYITKLSISQPISWLFTSVDNLKLNEALATLINNFEFEKALDLKNPNALLTKILYKISPSIIEGIKPVIEKIKLKGEADPFKNFKSSFINIIDLIDWHILGAKLNEYEKQHLTTKRVLIKNRDTGKIEEKHYAIALKVISPQDGIKAFLSSLFTNPGSNRAFKENIIKMFNLSSAVTVLEQKIGNETFSITLPKNDNDKLGFFDFIKIFSSILKSRENNIYTNFSYERILKQAKEILINADDNKTFNEMFIEFSDIRYILLNIANIDENISRDELLVKIDALLNFINQTKTKNKFYPSDTLKTGADLLNNLANFNSQKNSIWYILKTLIQNNAYISVENEYSLGAQAWDIYEQLFDFYTVKNVSQNEANSFVKGILELSVNPEILKLSQEKSSSNQIPIFGIKDYYLTKFIFDTDTVTLFKTNENGSYKNQIINQFVNQHPKFKKYIDKNQAAIIRLFGLIGISKMYSSDSDAINGIYHKTLQQFAQNYLFTDEFFQNRFEIIGLSNSLNKFGITSVLGIDPIFTNPILRFVYPEITLSLLINQTNAETDIKGNLAHIIWNKLIDFELLINNSDTKKASKESVKLSEYLDKKFNYSNSSYEPLNLDNFTSPSVDKDYYDAFENPDDLKFFGLNFIDLIKSINLKINEQKEIKDIVFNNTQSYVAKANYAWLKKNNKAIYEGKIPTNPLLIKEFIDRIPDKYLININGIKFVIIGEDLTADYLYPVVDENNLQVNTESQALVYVNKLGFDRIKLAYSGNVIKSSLLVKNETKLSDKELKEKISNIVDNSISDSAKLQRVFLRDEIDPINPERSLRVATVENVISTISVSAILLVILFSILTAVTVIFAIQRYIANKNKVLGILLSQGYTPTQIALSNTMFALVTSIIGGAIGYALGNRLQLIFFDLFNDYWSLPKTFQAFTFLTMFMTVFVPFLSISALIMITTVISLRHKPTELITGSVSIPHGKIYEQVYKHSRKNNVKRRFSKILAYSSFGKLSAFAASVTLTASATLFGIASSKTFDKTINETYRNRNYTFKVDLESPTIEGGGYKLFNPNDLNNHIYTPNGSIVEANREKLDFFRPGYSSVINIDGKNGSPKYGDSHILTQFSQAIKVSAGVSVNPWLVAYNAMPDSQKAKIDQIRDRVGVELEKTQSDGLNYKFTINPVNRALSLQDKNGNNVDFFKYVHLKDEKEGNFYLAKWDGKEYQKVAITTDEPLRTKYREFLVNGYKLIDEKIRQESELAKTNNQSSSANNIFKNSYWLADFGELTGPTVNDYFISFGGVYFDPTTDEKYTTLKAKWNNQSINIYGYQQNSKFIKLENENGENLYDVLYNFKDSAYSPLVINNVVAKKYNLSIGSEIQIKVENSVDRYLNVIKEKITKKPVEQPFYTFKVVGINPTHINYEFITTTKVANELIGFNKIPNFNSAEAFNGVLTNKSSPLQVTNSISLYSASGYWAGYSSVNMDDYTLADMQAIFDQIFNPKDGVLKHSGLTADEIMQFLDSTQTKFDQNIYNSIRENPRVSIESFTQIYNNKLYTALSTTIVSKDIELGFTQQISTLMNTLSISAMVVMLITSLIILIILSSIIINENQRNIAIWTILGYRHREKLWMFFSIFIPFIIAAVLISVPLVAIEIMAFNSILLSSALIALPLSLKWWHVILTLVTIFAIFIITVSATFTAISKLKPIDLLKGK